MLRSEIQRDEMLRGVADSSPLQVCDLLDVADLSLRVVQPPWKVLVVDDEEDVHGVTAFVLDGFRFDGRGIELLHAYSGAQAIAMFEGEPDIAVALVDVVMETERAGLDLVRHVREVLGNRFVRLILRTGQPGVASESEVVREYDINDYKTKTELSSAKFKSVMMTALRNYRDIVALKEKHHGTEVVRDAIIQVMVTLTEARDNRTYNHIRRTQHYLSVLVQALKNDPGFPELDEPEYVDLLFKSAPLHDIGKIGIPDRILNATRLTDEERRIMETHASLGRDAILSVEQRIGIASSFLAMAREIAGSHHEKWDGSGYPDGLAGTDIPLPARLMAVADAYDILISRNVNRALMAHVEAVAVIRNGAGQDFDPKIVAAFLRVEGEFAAMTQRFQDEGVPPFMHL